MNDQPPVWLAILILITALAIATLIAIAIAALFGA